MAYEINSMWVRFITIILFFFFFAVCKLKEPQRVSPKAIKGVLDLRDWDFDSTVNSENGYARLDGEWEFYWKELLEPDNILKDKNNSKYSQKKDFINVPGPWNSILINKKSHEAKGFATYRLKVYLNNPPNDIALKTEHIGTSFKLWVNGNLLTEAGTVSREEKNGVPGYLIKSFLLFDTSNELDIVVQVSNYHDRNGGLWRSFKLGKNESILNGVTYNYFLDFFLFGSLLIMGLYHVAIYIARRKDPSTIWFGIFSLLMSLRTLLLGEAVLYNIIQEFWVILNKLEYLTFYLGVPAFCNFLYALYAEEFNLKIKKFVNILGFIFSLIVILFPSYIYTQTLPAFQLFLFLCANYTIYVLIKAVKNKKMGSKIFLLGWIVFFVIILNDILFHQYIINTIALSPFGFFVFVFSQTLVLSMRYSTSFNQAEKLSEELKTLSNSLEQKVAIRTEQLNEMLEQVNKLYRESETKKKEMERLLESQKKLSLVGQMAAGIVHDIKNPMATIKTLAEMANSDRISKQKRMKNLVMIVREMDRLNDLAYEILDFSKGELNLNLTEVNLEEYISEIELFLRADFQYAGIDCILDIDYKGNILIDRDRMRRVLINLSKNAIEAMYDGKKDYKFIIRAEKINSDPPFSKGGQGGLRISLTDNGPGLSEAVEGRIFEAFATDGKAKGTGLGLFMSKWIVEAHNGSLTYETKHGEGTSFFITLPIAK